MLIKKESQKEFAELTGLKASSVGMYGGERHFHEVTANPDSTIDYVGCKELLAVKSEYDKATKEAKTVSFEDHEKTNKTQREFKLTTTYKRSEYDDLHYLLILEEEVESEEVIKSKSK